MCGKQNGTSAGRFVRHRLLVFCNFSQVASCFLTIVLSLQVYIAIEQQSVEASSQGSYIACRCSFFSLAVSKIFLCRLRRQGSFVARFATQDAGCSMRVCFGFLPMLVFVFVSRFNMLFLGRARCTANRTARLLEGSCGIDCLCFAISRKLHPAFSQSFFLCRFILQVSSNLLKQVCKVRTLYFVVLSFISPPQRFSFAG